MTKKTMTALAALALSATAALAQTPEAKPAPVDPAIFPEAKAGYTKHVLNIAPQENEGNFQIEIVAGMNMEVDCNTVMIGADLDSETLDGWGYNYFEIDDVSKPASTLMGCPDNTKTEKLVTLNLGNEAMIRYNSKLPVVVYAPENLTVGYRVWSTDGKLHSQAE